MIAAAEERAAEYGASISTALVDGGGHLIMFSRMDGASSISPQIAEAKAVGSAVLQRDGDAVARILETNPGAFAALNRLVRTPVFPVTGSLAIKRGDRCVGAIGVSGATSEQDLECAHAALAALAD